MRLSLIKFFILPILPLLMFAAFFRFANYPDRVTLHQDQARDAIIAQYSIDHKTLPLLGPPSSAGLFSFGPIYYWIIITFNFLTPFFVFGPWLGFTLLSLLSVYIFYLLGKNLYGHRFGLLLALLSAFCASEVINAPDMLNPVMISFFTTLALFSSVMLLKKQKLLYGLLLGLSVGVSLNLHLQAIGLLSLLIITPVMLKSFRILIVGSLGFIISFLPLIYFDIINKGIWIKSVLDYITTGQNKFNVFYALDKEIFSFWPKLWGEVISSNVYVGYLLLILFLFAFRKRFINRGLVLILSAFLFQIILIHFYKGPRMPMYLIVFTPFFIFLTGWVLWTINRTVGVSCLLIIIAISGLNNFRIISNPRITSQVSLVLSIKEKLLKVSPGPFSVYSYSGSNGISLPIYYLLMKEGRLSENGIKIGVCDHKFITNNTFGYDENCPVAQNPIVQEENYMIFRIQDTSQALTKIDPKEIFNSLYQNYLP